MVRSCPLRFLWKETIWANSLFLILQMKQMWFWNGRRFSEWIFALSRSKNGETKWKTICTFDFGGDFYKKTFYIEGLKTINVILVARKILFL